MKSSNTSGSLVGKQDIQLFGNKRQTRAGGWAVVTLQQMPGAPGVADTEPAAPGCPGLHEASGSHLPLCLVVLPHRDPSVLLKGTDIS